MESKETNNGTELSNLNKLFNISDNVNIKCTKGDTKVPNQFTWNEMFSDNFDTKSYAILFHETLEP